MNGGVPLSHGLALAGILFGIGLAGLLARRNVLFQILALEILLNAAGMAFVVAGARWRAPDGQVMFVFILAMAAAEVAIGLALVLALARHDRTLDADRLPELGRGR